MTDSEFYTEIEHVEEAVEKTLLYYKLFNSGINRYSLHSFLLDKKVSEEQLDDAIKSLLGKRIISLSDGTLYLDKEIESFYKRKNKTIDKKLTGKILKLLEKTPFISSIAFSGGTANYGIDKHEDIDLFIITKPYTVYLVYFVIHMASLLLRSRQIVCINYLVDETSVEIKIQRDLFTAHQIIALKPFKNENFLRYFLSSNEWVNNHYPNFIVPREKQKSSSVMYLLLRPVNYLICLLYRYRYKKYLVNRRDESIVLTENVIKLHTNDYRTKVIDAFQNQWHRYMLEKNKVSLT